MVRIGGDSTDWTWWPVRGMRRPPGVSYDLSPAWIARARALTESTGARLILGINLESGSTAIAATEARHLVDGIGRRHIEALEIGNEPELYNALPWYHTTGGAARVRAPVELRPGGLRRGVRRVSPGRSRLFRWPARRPARALGCRPRAS